MSFGYTAYRNRYLNSIKQGYSQANLIIIPQHVWLYGAASTKKIGTCKGFSFIPHHLKIEDRPELNNFPLKVIFVSWSARRSILKGALYKPDFGTFKQSGTKMSLKYRNEYGGDSWLKIKYNAGEGMKYYGEKYVRGKSVGMTCGAHWGGFFYHFTCLGLANGEHYEFTASHWLEKLLSRSY